MDEVQKEIETTRLKLKKRRIMPLFAPSRNYQLLAALSLIIFGVTKINNSFLSSVLIVFLNKNPITGMSAKKGTELVVLI